MRNERRYTVLVTFGTQPWRSVYGKGLTEAEALVMQRTARQHKYDDASIVKDYDPNEHR